METYILTITTPSETITKEFESDSSDHAYGTAYGMLKGYDVVNAKLETK